MPTQTLDQKRNVLSDVSLKRGVQPAHEDSLLADAAGHLPFADESIDKFSLSSTDSGARLRS